MKRKINSLLIASLILSSCGNRRADNSNEQTISEIVSCKLPRVVEGNIALGFPKVDGLAPSVGKVNMTVLFVDFEDAPAKHSVDSVFAIINPVAPDFFNEVSYGRMELNLNPHLEWLRLSEASSHYGKAIFEFMPHLNFIQEAVDLANDKVDFSETHIVLVISNPDAKAIPLGPTFNSKDPDYQIKADGASISSGITSGYDLNYWGGIWLAHETGHTFGLPDLYHFGSEGFNRYVGTFGLMGTCGAKAPGYFAFERWILGWIDDNQIYCHKNGEIVIEIDAIEKKGNKKAIIVPISGTSALVVESRRKIGFDKNIPKEGVLVYLVNTSLEGGSGPIQVKPGLKSDYEFHNDAPMTKGDTYIYKNISINVLESNKESDLVKVIVL
jgi:M6 family metalloprotease-like protein